jgi:CheY-like chemotaxis protein
MLSSIDIDKLRILAKELKINNYLLKPVSMSQLYDAVQNISYDKYQTVVSMNDTVQKEEVSDKATKINPFTDKTILVAEDNRVNILVIKKRLEDMGFNVLVAIDGNEAIKLVSTHKVDMILMDVHMPDLNGYEATQKIRENERAKDTHIPIIALTADAMKGDMEKCIASGMDDYLAKPFRPEELEEKIAKYIRF